MAVTLTRHHVGTVLSIALFVLSSCVAMRRALRRGDHSSAMSIAAATLLLAALQVTVRAYERAGYAAARRRLKALAWVLSSALTGMFAHRVSAVAPAPPPFAVLVWSMAGAAVTGGFYLLFVVHDDHGMEMETLPSLGTVVTTDRRQEP